VVMVRLILSRDVIASHMLTFGLRCRSGIQHKQCNNTALKASGNNFTVAACDEQRTKCNAATNA
jgi:hypothetical protein